VNGSKACVPGTVYVPHPFRDAVLVPLGSFHLTLQQEKEREFLRLCRHLGASRIHIAESKHDMSKKSGSASVAKGSRTQASTADCVYCSVSVSVCPSLSFAHLCVCVYVDSEHAVFSRITLWPASLLYTRRVRSFCTRITVDEFG
jgi:hypothetical protein